MKRAKKCERYGELCRECSVILEWNKSCLKYLKYREENETNKNITYWLSPVSYLYSIKKDDENEKDN